MQRILNNQQVLIIDILDLQELEKVLQKEGGIESSKLKSLDKESCEKVKKDLNEKDDDVNSE